MKNLCEKEKIIGKGFNQLKACRYGYTLYNKNDKYVGESFDKYGEFSENEVEIFRRFCGPDDIVIDIGANIGAHTLALADCVGSDGFIFSFEPQRVVHQNLCANVAINSLQNVKCENLALADMSGFTVLPSFDYNLKNNYGGVEAINPGISLGEKVQVMPLDRYFQFFEWPPIKFMKIDVEGMEQKVLSGAQETLKACQPLLYVENDRPEKSRELFEFLDFLRYTFYWHTPPLFNPHNFYKNPENIFEDLFSFNLVCIPKTYSQVIDFTGIELFKVDDFDYHPLKK
jgi:FkbM family methyltransferase